MEALLWVTYQTADAAILQFWVVTEVAAGLSGFFYYPAYAAVTMADVVSAALLAVTMVAVAMMVVAAIPANGLSGFFFFLASVAGTAATALVAANLFSRKGPFHGAFSVI